MPAIVLIDPSVTIASIDMSTHVKEVAIEVEADFVDSTAFNPAGWKSGLPGLKSGEIKVTFNDNFDASTVDDRIWTWFGTTVTFAVRADAGAVAATNPEYQGSAVVTKATPLMGKVGELAEQSLTWPTTGAVVRATS